MVDTHRNTSQNPEHMQHQEWTLKETVDFGWQCRFIAGNKCITQMLDVDSGEGCLCGDRGIWEIFVSSAQVCCEPKTALKNKVY